MKNISIGWYEGHSDAVTAGDTYILLIMCQALIKQSIFTQQMKKL